MLVQIDVGYACGGIVIDCGRVTQAAPIFKWMLGKNEEAVREWVKKKRGTLYYYR